MECPIEPDESECCNSGCNPCIFDVYEKQLQKYKKHQENALEKSEMQENCLQELKYVDFKLINIIRDSSCSNIYIFEHILNDTKSNKKVFYEPGQHLLLKSQLKYDKTDFTRAYTPIPWNGLNSNQFAVLIKLYQSGEMSDYIKKLKINSVTNWRGPYGDFELNTNQKSLLMIAQGTGIAPLYAIIKKLLENEDCEVRMKLIYCCKDFQHIHLHGQLYELLDYWNFKYELFLSDKITEDDVRCQQKYKEVVNARKLGDDNVKSALNEEEWSQILICGCEMFAKSISSVIASYSDVDVHCF